MLRFLLLLFFIIDCAFATKLNLDDRRKKILSIVDEELSEVSRLATQQDYKYPDTLLRLSELNLEKGRLYREAENEQYLAIPPENRRAINRVDFFLNSTKYFDQANNSALLVVKKFPNYKEICDVYYILAYNYKELGQHLLAQKYFILASKGAASTNQIGLKSKLSLAEYYYNDQKYSEAIPLYEASLKKLNEKWWTKDAFNLAWSYYRLKDYDKAINLMHEIWRKSSDTKYIDMKSTVERDIGIFYIDAGRMDEATKFYESKGLNYTEQFVKIASSIVSQGRFAQAESLLLQAEKNENNRDKRIEILIAQLNLFDKFNKISEHLKASQELVIINSQSPLSPDQLKVVSFHVNKKAAELQKLTASDTYKNIPKIQKEKSAQAITYFNLAGQLSPSQKAEKTFYQGETAYAANDFPKAIKLYLDAFDLAKVNLDKKIMSQSLEGMLSSLGQKNLDQKVAEANYVSVYGRYLAYDSKSDKAGQIFVKLFNVQFDADDIKASENTMAEFAKNFPKDFVTQEAMLAKVMDYHRKKKDYSRIKSYISKINDGDFKISAKYAEALKTLMTKIQIEGVQQSLEKGDKITAINGYHQIFESSESTQKAKTNAAYNLSALYYEIGDPNLSYKWSVIALNDMDVSEVTKFADSFMSIAYTLFLRQYFTQSSDLSHKILVKLCKNDSSNKNIVFKNSIFIALANNDLDRAIEIKEAGKNCSIPDAVISEISFEILKDLAIAKRWEVFEQMIKELEGNSKNIPWLIKPYEDLRKEYISIGNTDEASAVAKKQNVFYEQLKSQKVEIPVEALDLMAERMIVSLLEKKKKFDQTDMQFPEATFNAAVKNKLLLLDQMTKDVNIIQKIGSGKGIVDAYKYVIEAYESFGNALKKFTPPGKEQAYIDSFKKAMADVHGPILANAKKQRLEISKLIIENKILSFSNYSVLFPDIDKFKRYFSEKEAVLMEKGGRR
jgi:hypothetical protein